MPNDPTTTSTGPWQLLILDRDREDPKFILATVTAPRDVIPAPHGIVTGVDAMTAAWGRHSQRPAPPHAHPAARRAGVARR